MQELITAYADGELDQAQRETTQHHLAECAACAAALASLTALKSAMRADALLFNAPGELAKRIDSLIDKTVGPVSKAQPAKPTFTPKWLPTSLAAGLLLAGAIAAYLYFTPSTRERLDADAVAAHQRALSTNHLVDIATNDPQKLSAWFGSNSGFAPMIPNQVPQTMTLLGGRLDTLDGTRVAALVFRDGANLAEVFQWPASQTPDGPSSESKGNAHLTSWNDGARNFIALSEGSPVSIITLTGLFTPDRCGTGH
jgi:anti-sigma factor RsiW